MTDPAITNNNWTQFANCASTDPDLFFPESGDGMIGAAKRICDACDVKGFCIEEALANKEVFGVWGGVSARGLRRMRLAA